MGEIGLKAFVFSNKARRLAVSILRLVHIGLASILSMLLIVFPIIRNNVKKNGK